MFQKSSFFFFFCDNKISITLGRKINILSKNVLILKLEAHLIETNLHTGVGMDLRVAETSVLLCNSLLLVLSSSWKMVRWLMEIFSTLVMSPCPCIWTRKQTPKQVCFLCCLPQYRPIHLCYESYTDLMYCEKLCQFIQTSNESAL